MDVNTQALLELVRNRFRSSRKLKIYEVYILSLADKGLPPVLSFTHLADLLNLNVKTLYLLSFNQELHYKKFCVPKKSGGQRTIYAPGLLMDSVQRSILNNILDKLNHVYPPNVIGYVKGRTIKHHIEPHLSSQVVFKFDVKDFFPSIYLEDVASIFEDMGYSKRVAKTFASILTLNGTLPQGAPTSPVLSNLYMKCFDQDLIDYCVTNDFNYTRYVDDIVISGSDSLLKELKVIKGLFRKHRLQLNPAKTRVYKNTTDVKFITGLTLNDGCIRLPKAMRRKIRLQSHMLLKQLDLIQEGKVFQVKPEVQKDSFTDPIFYDRVMGRLNYWQFIEPDNNFVINVKKQINEKIFQIYGLDAQ